MDILAKNRLLIWLSVVLVVINIVSITALWLFYSGQHRNPPPKFENNNKQVEAFLNKELDLNDSQKHSLDSLLNIYKERTNKIREEIRLRHDSINSKIMENMDSIKIKYDFDSIGVMKARMDKLTFDFFREVYQKCNNEQKEKFRNLFRDISRMMAPGPTEKKK